MLPALLQHYDDSGQWLELIPKSIDQCNEEEPDVVYDFHHSMNHLDDEANKWLLTLFDRWVECLMVEIEFLKEPG